MNVERLRLLADKLETVEDLPWDLRHQCSDQDIPRDEFLAMDRFHMGDWAFAWTAGDECGAAGCVAGWTCRLFGDEKNEWVDPVKLGRKARDLLGLTKADADLLFVPDGLRFQKIPAAEAAKAVRKAADGRPREEWWSHVVHLSLANADPA